MGFSGSLPDHILSKIDAKERAKMGKSGVTRVEAEEKWKSGEESKMQALFLADMDRRGVFTIVSRFGKRTTTRKGMPDVICLYQGRACCVEVKAPGGVVSLDQDQCISDLMKAGIPVLVARSVKDAIDFVKEHLKC